MNLFKKVTTAAATGSLFLATAGQTFAADIIPEQSPIVDAEPTLELVVKWVVIVLVAVGIIAALVFLILGAIKWIISGGDKEKVAGARGQIIAAIIGLVVLLLAVVILSFVMRVLGVGDSIFDIKIPTVECFLNGRTDCGEA